MKTLKWGTWLLAMMFLVAALVACGQGGNESTGTQVQDEDEEQAFSVGMVTDVGGVDDNSFNESAWEGHQRLGEELGFTVDYLQSTDESDYQPNLNQMLRRFELVWGIGYMMADDLREVAEANPEGKFGIIDFAYEDEDGNPDVPENVVSVVFNEHEGSFLVGLIAGHMTETGQVGFLGGVELTLIKKFEYGFKAGVKAANPDVKILTNYAEAFDRADLGQTYGAAMYEQGADIIYHAAGQTGDGLFTEARNRGDVWVIGVDKDQSFLGEDITLTSMVKRVDNAIYAISEQTAEGDFPGGTIQSFGLADNGVGIADTQTHLTEEVLQLVEEYRQKIIDGEIKVPQTEEEYEEYLNSL